MRQLTGLDTQILALEDGRNHAHVSALAICDPATAPDGRLTLDRVRELIAARLHQLPPLRWKLVEVPFGLDYPYWVDAAEFDLDFHLRELALPDPGDERVLAEQVARIVSRPLDRSRPLWELYLIHGLEGGRVGMLTKIHHAAVDGASVAELLGIMLDTEPAPTDPTDLASRLERRGDAEPDGDARPRSGRASPPARAGPARAAAGAATPRRVADDAKRAG